MSTLTKERLKAISIEYLPSERELRLDVPLEVGVGLPDNFTIVEELGYQTFFGTKRYLCGLDKEMINYNENLTAEEKKAKTSEIDEIVKRLENFFGPGQLDPTNDALWSNVKLQLDRKTTNLNLTDPKTEILLYCIKAGGFNTVSPSIDKARESNGKFYLVEPIEYAENRVANTKITNKAISVLEKLDESKSYDDIFYIAKYLLPSEKGYTKNSPKAMLYEDLNKFIEGQIVKLSKVRCATQFVDATKKPKADIIITSLVKDGLEYGFLYINPSGEIKNNETGGVYGTTIEKAVAHLQNQAYQNEFENLKERVDKKWME